MNELQRIFIIKHHLEPPVQVPLPQNIERDKRYRVLVTLIRSDRPKYWNFLCNNCGTKLVELQNMDVIALDDFYDPQNVQNAGVGRHCKGTLPDGLPCQYTYFFHLS